MFVFLYVFVCHCQDGFEWPVPAIRKPVGYFKSDFAWTGSAGVMFSTHLGMVFLQWELAVVIAPLFFWERSQRPKMIEFFVLPLGEE